MMQDDLVKDIIRYIDYLQHEQDLSITIHFIEPYLRPYLHLFLKYNLHSCTLCSYAKQSVQLWKHCIERQKKVLNHAKNGAYFGMCWVGVSEFIVPVQNLEGQPIMFICVSGYAVDEKRASERMKAVSRNYALNYEEMQHIFRHSMKKEIPSLEQICTLVLPLSRMLTLLAECVLQTTSTQTQPDSDSHRLFTNAIQYINRNYASDISLESISTVFNCSPSYLSHVFNRFAGCSLPCYVNRQRMELAQQFLRNTQMQIQEIAFSLGFNDANYFSSVFRNYCGLSPRQWRKQQQTAEV